MADHKNGQLCNGKDATQRANDIWKQALKECEEPAMDRAIRDALDEYVAWRRTEIGSDDSCFIPASFRPESA